MLQPEPPSPGSLLPTSDGTSIEKGGGISGKERHVNNLALMYGLLNL